jgi:hypothetical protein
LRHGHDFEHVSIRIAKVEAAAAAPIVELAVVEAPRGAAESDVRFLDTAEDGVEFAIADMEGEVMAFELAVVVKQQRQRFVDLYRREIAAAPALEAEDAGEKLRRFGLVAGPERWCG